VTAAEATGGGLRDLILLGGGVHGSEMVEIVERINRAAPTWNLLGMISPHVAPAGQMRNGCPVLGLPDTLDRYPDALFVPDNEWPLELPPDERLASIVDPSAWVSRTARIGPGCVLYPNCFVGLNATVGRRVFCLSGCVINHDCIVEERTVMACGVTLAGSVTVESGCYLGQSCTVRQRLRIGRGSLIGMGAVVVNDIPANSVVVGNPGRVRRQRDEA
jgi:carbonic anhydrase/acetyltransferase-like protein (isoleucine patch superfamily)